MEKYKLADTPASSSRASAAYITIILTWMIDHFLKKPNYLN